jgi:phosphatidylglycerol:prolipoprotein diacylglycerol transferase
MFVHNINPVLLTLGPFEIKYYGLMYLLGFAFAFLIIRHFAKKGRIILTADDTADFISYQVLGIIIFARLFYAFVYNFSYYMSKPIEILMIWQGGLSFHGGLIGAVIASWIFCRRKKIDFYSIADIAVIPLGFALFLGRIGNFINGELYGRVTSVPWAVKFPNAEGYRHPSQIYEAGKNLVIFIVQWSIRNRELPKGFRFWLFVLMYSSFRFCIEFFREPDAQIGFVYGLTLGQWINIVMFLVGLIFFVKVNRRRQP